MVLTSLRLVYFLVDRQANCARTKRYATPPAATERAQTRDLGLPRCLVRPDASAASVLETRWIRAAVPSADPERAHGRAYVRDGPRAELVDGERA